jgi:Cft2 family RNA processing exonuclease
MRASDLLKPRPEGLYCPPGDFFIDPVRPVGRALITHGHSDHARSGHGSVLATQETLDIMGLRYGEDFAGTTQAAILGEAIDINGVSVTFHPAGHVLGSAQIAVEHRGMRIVASGDYKRQKDATCAPFEPVACDVFITEATFGLPVFKHPPDHEEIARVLKSAAQFPERSHLIGAYALGKAQRVMRLLRDIGSGPDPQPVPFEHDVIGSYQEVRRQPYAGRTGGIDDKKAPAVRTGTLADVFNDAAEGAEFGGHLVPGPGQTHRPGSSPAIIPPPRPHSRRDGAASPGCRRARTSGRGPPRGRG